MSAKTQEQFIVRFPDGMRDRIRSSAEANHRSMNSEIIALIEEGFGQRARWTPPPASEAISDGEVDEIISATFYELFEDFRRDFRRDPAAFLTRLAAVLSEDPADDTPKPRKTG